MGKVGLSFGEESQKWAILTRLLGFLAIESLFPGTWCRKSNNIKPTSVHHEHHHGHDHKTPIASLSVELPGSINHPLFRYWLSTLLFDHSDHIYRMKGIVNIAGRDEKLIFQAVHRLFEDRPGPCWQDGEKRVSRMVFIGENIDRDFIVEGFKGCLEKEDK